MSFLNIFRSHYFVIGLILASIICLYPGLTHPMLSINISASLPLIGEIELYNQIQSIWGGIVELVEKDYFFVAFLIFLFSVAIPIIKLFCIAALLIMSSSYEGSLIHQFVLLIGKWSMADVFVVAIFIAFLGSGAKANIQAELHSGFYWFLSYCLISIVCGQLLNLKEKSYNVS